MDSLPMPDSSNDYDPPFERSARIAPVYEPLPDGYIRLLSILPGNYMDEIRCEIKAYALTPELEYKALSYAWGSGPDIDGIRLNGHHVCVRRNLYRFLREARKLVPETFNLCWIDALCIDQSNNVERTKQVNLMKDIFSMAERVIVWLGPSYGGSDGAMDYLARVPPRWDERKNFSIRGKTAGLSISVLCRRPYWRRLWILQEVMLAEKVSLMCGDRIAPWEPFRKILLQIHDEQSKPRKNAARIHRQQDSIEHHVVQDSPAMVIILQTMQETRRTSLYDLIFATQHLRCAEKRDKVYALLGIAGQGVNGISPDYQAPFPKLLNVVLRNYHEHERPRNLDEVMQQCEQLCTLLGVDSDFIFRLVDGQGRFPAPEQEAIAAFPIGPGNPITLWWASFYGHSMVEELLENDRGTDMTGWLQVAAENGKEAPVRLILGARTANCRSQALQVACDNALQVASGRGHQKVAELLIEHGANVNAGGQLGTALLAASVRGHLKIVEMLIARGADVDAWDGKYGSAARAASVKGHQKVAEMLAAKSAVQYA